MEIVICSPHFLSPFPFFSSTIPLVKVPAVISPASASEFAEQLRLYKFHVDRKRKRG